MFKRFRINSPVGFRIEGKKQLYNAITIEALADDILVADEYHSMDELYDHRLALNVALFRAWHQNNDWIVMRSKLHADGTMFDGYFIVMAVTGYGQISYHYKLKHWEAFDFLPEVPKTPKWDGHGSLQVIERLMKL